MTDSEKTRQAVLRRVKRARASADQQLAAGRISPFIHSVMVSSVVNWAAEVLGETPECI